MLLAFKWFACDQVARFKGVVEIASLRRDTKMIEFYMTSRNFSIMLLLIGIATGCGPTDSSNKVTLGGQSTSGALSATAPSDKQMEAIMVAINEVLSEALTKAPPPSAPTTKGDFPEIEEVPFNISGNCPLGGEVHLETLSSTEIIGQKVEGRVVGTETFVECVLRASDNEVYTMDGVVDMDATNAITLDLNSDTQPIELDAELKGTISIVGGGLNAIDCPYEAIFSSKAELNLQAGTVNGVVDWQGIICNTSGSGRSNFGSNS